MIVSESRIEGLPEPARGLHEHEVSVLSATEKKTISPLKTAAKYVFQTTIHTTPKPKKR